MTEAGVDGGGGWMENEGEGRGALRVKITYTTPPIVKHRKNQQKETFKINKACKRENVQRGVNLM